ncbi:hypothetical protein DFJ77DRAFT_471604 [Powellomyces hirtus]|nr:hypothetical protein DFJ77DRAFT_471604 [Powellomyces hirtus]
MKFILPCIAIVGSLLACSAALPTSVNLKARDSKDVSHYYDDKDEDWKKNCDKDDYGHDKDSHDHDHDHDRHGWRHGDYYTMVKRGDGGDGGDDDDHHDVEKRGYGHGHGGHHGGHRDGHNSRHKMKRDRDYGDDDYGKHCGGHRDGHHDGHQG